MKNKRVGRPSKYKGIDSLVVGKLAEAFKQDFTVEEACHYACVHKTTFYDWIKKYPEFSYEMEASMDFVAIEAKKVVKSAIQSGDLKMAKWFLEHRQKERYFADQKAPSAETQGVLVDTALNEVESEEYLKELHHRLHLLGFTDSTPAIV